ncbi:MAG: Amidohydro-rel protein [Dehalococcoidia bacterium]|nr:Amidohydro-rel protein [Dehalococcoidia bacterium]
MIHLQHNLISADDHVMEHPAVWTSRLSQAKFGDRIPQVRKEKDGTERWFVDNKPLSLQGASSPGVAAVGGAMPDVSMEPQTWAQVPKSTYVPSERLKAMDIDGVDMSVLYPTIAGLAGETFGSIPDPELEIACVRAYNDFLIDEWAKTSSRFLPLCIVPISSMEATIAELERAVKKGAVGVAFPSIPWHLRDVPHINEPYWDTLWNSCEELHLPLSFHAGASPKTQMTPAPGLTPEMVSAFKDATRALSTGTLLPNLLMSGILERHPHLKIVFAESSLTLATYVLEFTDHGMERQRKNLEGHPVWGSELFRRHCYLTGSWDVMGVKTRRYTGTDGMLWSSNYPLANSTFPKTQTYIERAFAEAEVPKDEQTQLRWGNAARLYRVVAGAKPGLSSRVIPFKGYAVG